VDRRDFGKWAALPDLGMVLRKPTPFCSVRKPTGFPLQSLALENGQRKKCVNYSRKSGKNSQDV
jgi:hypothetical protein